MPVATFQIPEVKLNVQIFRGEVSARDLDEMVAVIGDPASHTFEHDVLGVFADDTDVAVLPLSALAAYRRRIDEVVERNGFTGCLKVAQVARDARTISVLRFWQAFTSHDARYRWRTRTFATLDPACAWLGLSDDGAERVRAELDRVIGDGLRRALEREAQGRPSGLVP